FNSLHESSLNEAGKYSSRRALNPPKIIQRIPRPKLILPSALILLCAVPLTAGSLRLVGLSGDWAIDLIVADWAINERISSQTPTVTARGPALS
ncbi:hypothetical protein, partial [Arthrobacter sp. VKM Ac-2550]|uniref:hypothetical protein n=1 Tax=Crystallibacter permensis TaxID=1938888 RepID=UPI0022261BDF